MIFTFWFFICLIVYCYFGYPILLVLVSSLYSRPVFKKDITPKISIVISVWNEHDVIRQKISNLLALQYPSDHMEILIGSDGSDDGTNDIIRSFKDKRIRFLERKDRRGKMAVLNELVSMARHEIIVFNDARQELPEDAISKLVSNFADPNVGCVSGELVFRQKDGATAKGINLYWEYEKFMRNHEARIHSMLGATGAMYAIRKNLYQQVPHHVVLDDMYIPFRVIEQGYRAIFEPEAKAYDNAAEDPKEEYRRKTRTLFGNFQIFQIFGHMFNPFKSPIAIQLFSHKFLRILAPFLMIGLICINLTLVGQKLYVITMALQISFYLMALLGLWAKGSKYGIFRKISKLCYIPYVFCLLNFSVLAGCWRFINSKQDITWEKARKNP
jgi:cellulose synthase/poly-beta-1,6-N-acetylglucosamine synthase-like glycosyltransferase